MKKRILSVIAVIALLLTSVPAISAADAATLSPRASVILEDGYIDGIVGIPTADYVASQFEGDVAVVNPKGDTISGETAVPAESVVKSGDAELCRVIVYGDSNCDGKVNVSDASAMLKKIAKWDVGISETSSDVNDDGKLNVGDVSALLKYIAKWDVVLSAPIDLTVIADGAAEYKLLANDADTDAAVVSAIKSAAGVDIQVITEADAGQKFITVGLNLYEKYDFIDKAAVEALDADKAYIDTYAGNIYITANSAEGIETATDMLAAQYDGEDLVIRRGYYGPMTHMTEQGALYWDAVANILKTEPAVDGTNGMNEDILVAISNATYTAPKNIIYMIGDGMGKNIVTAAEYCHKDDLFGGKMTMNYLPNEGLQSTYASDYQITDSAAGGTALATGYKTGIGVISKNADKTANHKTLLELAAEMGKDTGIIATKSVTDATPATFTAHVDDRSEEIEIARQQLMKLADGSLDLVLGGGYDFYDNALNAGAMSAAVDAGVTYTKNWSTVESASLPIAGIFTAREMATDGSSGEPHIAAMTDLALDLLSEDEDGFFLMVEGSKIDTYGHNNDFGTEVDETYEFDCAVAVALRFVALNPDTVLIITADHETGELSIPGEPTVDNIRTGSRYASGGHHWVDVPVYAVGYRTEELVRLQENTDVAIFIAEIMGEENFGSDSTDVYDLFDLTDKATVDAIKSLNGNSDDITATKDGIRVSFGGDIKNLMLPLDKIVSDPDKTQNVAAVRITYTYIGTSPKTLPLLAVKCDVGSYTIGERITFIDPGETFEHTYVLDTNAKNNGAFNSTYEMILSSRSTSGEFVISGITVVNRPFGE